MAEIIEMGTVSSRGQIAIPSDIRKGMGMKDGQKVLFFLDGDTLIIKRVNSLSWGKVTRPLKEAAKMSRLKESDVSDIVTKFRSKKK